MAIENDQSRLPPGAVVIVRDGRVTEFGGKWPWISPTLRQMLTTCVI